MTFFCVTFGFSNVNSLPKTIGEKNISRLNLYTPKWEKATEQFYKKLNANLFEHVFESEDTMFLWIKANLESTKFISIDEARTDWSEIVQLQKQEFYKNSTIKINSIYAHLLNLELQNLIINKQISDECSDNFMKHSEAHSEIYADQIQILYNEYKGQEQDERFNKIHSAIEKNNFIRMNNCTNYLRNCMGL